MLRWIFSFVRPQWEIEGRLQCMRKLLGVEKQDEEKQKSHTRVDHCDYPKDRIYRVEVEGR